MKYLIIGGSAAGVSAIEPIREIDKESEITLISDEKTPLYSRCLLTYLLAGDIDEDKLRFKTSDFYEKNNVNAVHGAKATKIDARAKKVFLEDKRGFEFDKLLIATGSSAKSLDIPGVDKEGIFTVRKLDDAKGIEKLLDKTKTVAVLGGGLIGLRDAYALHARGKKIVVIIKSNQVLSQMLDKEGADIIQKRIEENGISVMTGLAAKEILGEKSVKGLILDNDERMECEMVIIGKGVTANMELAKEARLKTHWGIAVDDYLKTSADSIYAAGDVAETMDIARGESWTNALWPVAAEQGKIAGQNMAGKKVKYEGSLSMNSVEFFGLPTISMGITKPKGEGYELLNKMTSYASKKLILKGNRIVGLVLAGEVNNAGVYGIFIKKKIDVSTIKDVLLEDGFDYGTILPLIKKEMDRFEEKEFKDTVSTYEQ